MDLFPRLIRECVVEASTIPGVSWCESGMGTRTLLDLGLGLGLDLKLRD